MREGEGSRELPTVTTQTLAYRWITRHTNVRFGYLQTARTNCNHNYCYPLPVQSASLTYGRTTESSFLRGIKRRFGAKTAHGFFTQVKRKRSTVVKNELPSVAMGGQGRKTNTERPISHFHDVALSIYVSYTFIRKPTRQPLARKKQPAIHFACPFRKCFEIVEKMLTWKTK